jgi:tetratricopeptide (TPR) repeat protein
MMNRFYWSISVLGVVAFVWWSFFAKVSTKQENVLYPEEHFLEDVSKIYSDIGTAALGRGDLSKAIKSYQETVAMRPTWLEGYDRLGTTYELNNQPQEALRVYAHAMSINPDFIDYRQQAGNKAKLPARTIPALPSKSVEWTGQDLTDKKIFVFAEKTAAETLMFCRFLPLLRSKAAKVYFKPQEPLVSLVKQAKLGVIVCNNYTNLADLEVDFHISLLSLLHYLSPTLEQINSHTAYLKSNAEKVVNLRKAFFNTNEVKIGIAWHNVPYKTIVKNVDVTPAFFAPLSQIPGVKLYSLQKITTAANMNVVLNAKITDLSEQLPDFSDIAAAIENLDLLITADTTLAALAGGLNKKTWLLTPSVSDWRWFGYWEKNKTVWFDHFKKIPQSSGKDWQPTLGLLNRKIENFLTKRQKHA